MPSIPKKRDPTFLRLAAVAALGGFGAIGTSIFVTVISWHGGHPTSTYMFFSLWGIAALAGAVANVVVYFQSGDPPTKPPRGGARVLPFRTLDVLPNRTPERAENERKAA